MASKEMTYFDPDFKIHTSYHNSFFTLRTPIHINGLPVQIRSTGQGPLLSFTQSGVTISVKLWEISHLVGPIFLKYGVYNVDTFYYEQCPLFQVAFPSEDLLKRFLLASEAVSSEVDSALSEIFTQRAQSSESDEALDSTPFNVQAKVELFLVTPSHEKNKAAVIHPITLANFSVCTSLWKNSELFEFGRVFATYCTATEKGGLAVPRIVRLPEEISPKQVAMFSIHTTGSKPLQYCWEWKPPGEGEEWKSLANGDDKFKGGGTATLIITDVQKAVEGIYRCTLTSDCTKTAIPVPDTLSLGMMALKDTPYFDADFKIHTSYHNSFFILRTPILINGLPVQISDTGQGPLLSFTQSGVTISAKLWEISRLVGPIFYNHGVYHVDTFYHGQFPLFQVAFPSEVSLKRFLLASDTAVSSEVELALSGMLTQRVQSSESSKALNANPLNVQAKVELFLVSPSHEKKKATNAHPINISNFSSYTSLWKNSKLFEFGQVFAMYCTATKEGDLVVPEITGHPQDKKDACQSEVAVFTVQATGSEPLQYCWEWSPLGEGEGWQPLPSGRDRIQGVETATLTIDKVQESDEGKYRCTVTSYPGSMISESAVLSVVDPPKIVSHPQDSKDIMAKERVTFSIQATGTEPLSYCWQSRPLEDGQEWKPLLCNSTEKLQGVKMGTLIIADVQKLDEGSYRCTVTNCTGSETSQPAQLTVVEPVTIVDLLKELEDVNDWFHFGIFLRVPISMLEAIEKDYKTAKERKTRMLIQWGREAELTWAGVVQALVGMGRKALATHIGTKYDVPVPDMVDQQLCLEQIANFEEKVTDGRNLAEIKRLGEHAREVDEELLENEKEWKASAASQAAANENLSEIKDELSKLQRKVEHVVQERNSLQMELKHTKTEFELLKELKDIYKSKSDEEVQAVHRMVDAKERGIRKLEEQLKAKEAELQPLQQEVNGLREELAKRTTELLEKTKLVDKLERERDQLMSTYKTESSRVDMVLQQMAAQANSHESYRTEIKQQLSDMKIDRETKVQQLEALTTENIELEEKIKTLSAALEEKESVVAALQGAREDIGETLMKIPVMEREISEMKVMLSQAQSQKERKEMQRSTILQDGEAMKEFAVQLQTMLEPPKITTEPRDLEDVILGTTVTLTVQATGHGPGAQPLRYHWEFMMKSVKRNQWKQLPNGGDRIQGVETATMTIDNVQKSLDEGEYRCIVSNGNGSVTSRHATLRLAGAPRIIHHPQDSKDVIAEKAEGDLQHQVLFPQTQMHITYILSSGSVGNNVNMPPRLQPRGQSAQSDLPHPSTMFSVPSGSVGYNVNMPPRLQPRGRGDMQMRGRTYRSNLGPTSIAPSTQTVMQMPGQPMQIGGLLQQHPVLFPQQHLTLLQTPQAGLRQTMIPHQALHGHQGGLLPLHQMPPAFPPGNFPGTAFGFPPTNQPINLTQYQPRTRRPIPISDTNTRAQVSVDTEPSPFSPTNQPVNLQAPAMQVQPPTSQQPSYVPLTTNNRTQYQPRTRRLIPIIDPNTRAQVSVDTEPPPVPSSGAHVDSSDSSSGVGGGGAPHHPAVAEDFKQSVQEAVHEAPSVHLTEESAPSDTQAESQTETESGSLEPKLETGSDGMELGPEPIPTSEHKNKLEEEDVKGVEETVTEPEMTVPETKDDSQEAEGDAAAPTPSQTPLIPPPSLHHGRTTYSREFILQFKAMEVCKQPPKELESTESFKPFAFRDQPPMDVFLPFGGGGGKSDKRREPKKIITQPQRVEKLEFLESGGGSSQPSQEPAYLKDLITLFGDTDTTNDDIFDWIEQNCPAEVHNTPPFVRVLTTAAVQGTCSGSGTSARFEEKKFNRRLILLKKYVRETEELQLHVLYALQVAIAKLQHPPGVLNSMFNIVYDLDLVGEKVYTQWKDKGTETFGKGVALQAVKSFLEWLKCAEQESDEEGGGWNT